MQVFRVCLSLALGKQSAGKANDGNVAERDNQGCEEDALASILHVTHPPSTRSRAELTDVLTPVPLMPPSFSGCFAALTARNGC
jgi:hypothetical protein